MMLAKDNVDNIIRAFKRVCDDFSDVDLYLYGTPNDKDKSIVEGVIAELGLGNRVFIKGRIDYNLVPQTLANAEILVTSQPVTKRAAGHCICRKCLLSADRFVYAAFYNDHC